MNRHSISGNNTEQVLQSQITDLQSNIVVDGIVKNIDSILLNLAAGDTLEWYVTVDGYTAKIGGDTSNGGTTAFNAVRIVPGYTAA